MKNLIGDSQVEIKQILIDLQWEDVCTACNDRPTLHSHKFTLGKGRIRNCLTCKLEMQCVQVLENDPFQGLTSFGNFYTCKCDFVRDVFYNGIKKTYKEIFEIASNRVIQDEQVLEFLNKMQRPCNPYQAESLSNLKPNLKNILSRLSSKDLIREILDENGKFTYEKM